MPGASRGDMSNREPSLRDQFSAIARRRVRHHQPARSALQLHCVGCGRSDSLVVARCVRVWLLACVSREWTTSALIAAFTTLGYAVCETSDLADGVEKVALYVANGRPTHAARQLDDGAWSSKCGRAEDIRHVLTSLAGEIYGEPTIFLARPRSR